MAAIPTVLQILVAFLGAYFIALWFSMIIWAYYDIRARSQDLYVHIFATALVVVFNVFGLLLYFILRPRETLAEARLANVMQRRLLDLRRSYMEAVLARANLEIARELRGPALTEANLVSAAVGLAEAAS